MQSVQAMGRMIERLRAAADSREAVNMTNMLNGRPVPLLGAPSPLCSSSK